MANAPVSAEGRSAAVFETPAFFSFHHINAFEVSQRRIVVDTVALTGIDFSNSLDSSNLFEGEPGKGVVTRIVIDAKTGQVSLAVAVLCLSKVENIAQHFVLHGATLQIPQHLLILACAAWFHHRQACCSAASVSMLHLHTR